MKPPALSHPSGAAPGACAPSGAIAGANAPSGAIAGANAPSGAIAGASARAGIGAGARARARLRSRDGFTLVEALVVLVLLSVGAIALLTLQTRLRLASDEARHHDQALRLARNELERWRWRPDAPAPTMSWEGPDIAFDIAGQTAFAADALNPGGDSTPGASSDTPPLRPVRVRVSWTERSGRPRSVTLDSLLPLDDPALPGWLLRPP